MTNDDSYLPDFSFNDLGNKTHNNSNVEIVNNFFLKDVFFC